MMLCTIKNILLNMGTLCLVTPLFSPYDNIEKVIIHHIERTKESIHCSMYGISNPNLVTALLDATDRKVEVVIGMDQRQSDLPSDLHKKLEKHGVEVVIKPTGVLEHNKFCIFDNKSVIMGSWNWSQSASKQDNSEVVISECIDTIRAFEFAFQRIIARDMVR